jgi:predicted phosphoribosyltransferase
MGEAEQHGVLPFRDREEAGRLLADALLEYAGRHDVLVLALPRGGIPVASEVARALSAPLDVLVVRKMAAPANPELAIGAVAPAGICILQEKSIAEMGMAAGEVAALAAAEQLARTQSEALYRRHVGARPVEGGTVIVVDDGIATGATMRAAIAALRAMRAARIVAAVPVASAATCRELRRLADQVVCLAAPEIFFAVGQWYVEFEQVSDQQVAVFLEQASTFVA